MSIKILSEDRWVSLEDAVVGRPVLSRWERVRMSDGEYSMVEVAVDVAGALRDALLPYDVPAGRIIEDFFRLVADPSYREG